jgi:hypothetical protein
MRLLGHLLLCLLLAVLAAGAFVALAAVFHLRGHYP